MPTLCIRGVPDAVASRLEDRAAEEGQSLSAYVVRQLEVIADRPSRTDAAIRLMPRDA